MQFNADKYFTMRVGRSKTIINKSYKLHDHPLQGTDSVKYITLKTIEMVQRRAAWYVCYCRILTSLSQRGSYPQIPGRRLTGMTASLSYRGDVRTQSSVVRPLVFFPHLKRDTH